MKKLIISMMLFISGCSGGSGGSNGPNPEVLPSADQEISTDNLTALSADLSLNSNFSNTIELRSSALGDIVKTIKIKNTSSSDQSLDLKILNNSKMQIIFSRCPSVLTSGSDCIIQVVHNTSEVANGTFSGFLQIAAPDLGVQINSTVSTSTYVPTTDGSVATDLTVSFTKFDSYVPGTRVVRQVTLSNSSSTQSITNLSYTLPSGYKIVLSQCGDSLSPNSSCQLFLSFSDESGDINLNDEFIVSSGVETKTTDLLTKTFVATYSDYSPLIPSLSSCEGSVVSTRTIIECRQEHDNALVSNSLCTDSAATVETQSPAGNKTIAILEGEKTVYCEAGSTTETFVSASCSDPLTYEYLPNDMTGTCNIITYTPSFSEYTPAIPTLSVCDGTVVSTRGMTCTKDSDGSTVLSSFCGIDMSASVSTLSPSGEKTLTIDNGSRVVSCSEGSSTQSFVSAACSDPSTYHYGPNDLSGTCSLITYTVSHSSYSPAIPTLSACEESVVSTRSTTCTRDYDGSIVANSFCPTDTSATVTTDAPAGNKTIQIQDGSRIVSCPAASTAETFVSGSCTDPGTHFYAPNDISGTCSVITYTASHSAYNPPVAAPAPCEPATVSTRLTTCTRDHDGVSVDIANCPVDSDNIITTPSLAGTKTIDLTNGSRVVSCEANSMIQTFVSGSCTNATDEYLPQTLTGTCTPITYTVSHSEYTPTIPTLSVCDGTVVSTRTTSCVRNSTGATVDNSFCPTDTEASVSTLSPAGTKHVTISNGSRDVTCAEGSSTQVYVANSGTCLPTFNYSPNTIAGTCVPDVPLSLSHNASVKTYNYSTGVVTATDYDSFDLLQGASSFVYGTTTKTVTFSGAGGLAPYTYSIVEGNSSRSTINATTGVLTVAYGSSDSTINVKVVDSLSTEVTKSITLKGGIANSCQNAITRKMVNTSGTAANGYYLIDFDGNPANGGVNSILCDQANGGWTVVIDSSTIGGNQLSYMSAFGSTAGISGSFIYDGLGYGWGVVNNDTYNSQFKGFQIQVNPGFTQISITYAAVRNDNEFCWINVGSKNLNDLYIFNDNFPYFAVTDVVSLVGQYLFNQTIYNSTPYNQGLDTTSYSQTYSGAFSNMQNLNMARPTAVCQQRFQKVMYK